MRTLWIIALLSMAACSSPTNFTPREKTATYDPRTGQLTLPHPCPDWSQSQSQNYKNEKHSNFGCAVNTNLAVQLEDPQDLHHGHGKVGPDPEISEGVVESYRAGNIPKELTPIQSTGTGQ